MSEIAKPLQNHKAYSMRRWTIHRVADELSIGHRGGLQSAAHAQRTGLDRAQKVESTRRGSPRGDDDRFSQRVLPLVEEEPGTDVGAVDDVEGVDDIVEAD